MVEVWKMEKSGQFEIMSINPKMDNWSKLPMIFQVAKDEYVGWMVFFYWFLDFVQNKTFKFYRLYEWLIFGLETNIKDEDWSDAVELLL